VLQGTCQIFRTQRIVGIPAALAPLWHLRVLVALVLAVATAGTLLGPPVEAGFVASSRITAAYLPIMIVNVALAAYVGRFGLERGIFRELFASGGYDYRRLLGDTAWAVALALGLMAIENGRRSRSHWD
jgi:hypothetical protein